MGKVKSWGMDLAEELFEALVQAGVDPEDAAEQAYGEVFGSQPESEM